MDDTTPPLTLQLTSTELQVVRTALRLLFSSLGRDEADELEDVRAVLDKVERLATA
jgi:hypothetical protein